MTSAPIHALTTYYERLAADPSQEIARLGFAQEKIAFCVVLTPRGELRQVQDLRVEEETGGKTKKKVLRPRLVTVPDRGGRSGTLIKANFLFDNTGYALGVDGKGRPARSREAFEAFRDLHRQMLSRCNDRGLEALCAFLDAWVPEHAVERIEAAAGGVKWDDICDSNVVFRLQGEEGYIHDSAALQDAWVEFAALEETPALGHSLVSGREEPLARLHPMIKGVIGAQTSGAAIVSFNQDSFESYGKSQSFNAPVGVGDAFRYTTALNRLLADKRRRIRIGETTVVFWAGAAPRPAAGSTVELAEDAFAVMFQGAQASAEDAPTVDSVRLFWQRAREALLANKGLEGGDAPFYILGLSPNASRLAVRFWLAGTVDEFAKRLAQHARRLEVVKPPDADPLTDLALRRLVLETARPKNGWPDEESVSPLLAGAVLRAVLSGGSYPQALLGGVIARIRAEGFADPDKRNDHVLAAWRRAAILKSMVIPDSEQEAYVSLNLTGPPAYQLGRLFAVLEKTQDEAFDNNLNATIKDRYFGSASANPIAAFPRLLRLHVHHLGKLANPGRRTNLEKLVQEICSNVGDQFPRNLALQQQGQFFLGYYHQRQDLFTRKNDDDKSNSTDTITESKER
jgi:CRISPR-associated protein Csd1